MLTLTLVKERTQERQTTFTPPIYPTDSISFHQFGQKFFILNAKRHEVNVSFGPKKQKEYLVYLYVRNRFLNTAFTYLQ